MSMILAPHTQIQTILPVCSASNSV